MSRKTEWTSISKTASRRIVEAELVRAVLVERQSKTKVAAAFGVCRGTAGKWVARLAGQGGLCDRSIPKGCIARLTPVLSHESTIPLATLSPRSCRTKSMPTR
jgi:transposase-like protein